MDFAIGVVIGSFLMGLYAQWINRFAVDAWRERYFQLNGARLKDGSVIPYPEYWCHVCHAPTRAEGWGHKPDCEYVPWARERLERDNIPREILVDHKRYA